MTCEECEFEILETEDFVDMYETIGFYHEDCHQKVTAQQQAEAGIPPHSYRVNTNAAYDLGNYKNTDYMEGVLDAD